MILELNLKFKKELLLRETVIIKTYEAEFMSKKIFNMKQEMIKKDSGQIASELSLNVGLFDTKKRGLVLPTKEWLKVFQY